MVAEEKIFEWGRGQFRRLFFFVFFYRHRSPPMYEHHQVHENLPILGNLFGTHKKKTLKNHNWILSNILHKNEKLWTQPLKKISFFSSRDLHLRDLFGRVRRYRDKCSPMENSATKYYQGLVKKYVEHFWKKLSQRLWKKNSRPDALVISADFIVIKDSKKIILPWCEEIDGHTPIFKVLEPSASKWNWAFRVCSLLFICFIFLKMLWL